MPGYYKHVVWTNIVSESSPKSIKHLMIHNFSVTFDRLSSSPTGSWTTLWQSTPAHHLGWYDVYIKATPLRKTEQGHVESMCCALLCSLSVCCSTTVDCRQLLQDSSLWRDLFRPGSIRRKGWGHCLNSIEPIVNGRDLSLRKFLYKWCDWYDNDGETSLLNPTKPSSFWRTADWLWLKSQGHLLSIIQREKSSESYRSKFNSNGESSMSL